MNRGEYALVTLQARPEFPFAQFDRLSALGHRPVGCNFGRVTHSAIRWSPDDNPPSTIAGLPLLVLLDLPCLGFKVKRNPNRYAATYAERHPRAFQMQQAVATPQ